MNLNYRGSHFPLGIILLFLLTTAHGLVLSQTDNHGLSVNFVSIGSGIDSKAQTQLSDFIKKFQKDNKVTLDYKIQPWGKEGETEYIFNIKNLKTRQRKAFTNSLREMFKENKLVKVTDKA